MPCYDGRENTAAADLSERNRKLQRRLDLATRVACELARHYKGQIRSLSVEATNWIKDHEAEDARRAAVEAERKKAQQLKEAALKKLTKEERRALGI